MPCFAVAAVYGGEQNGSNQIYYFRIFNSEIIYSIVHTLGKYRLRSGLCEAKHFYCSTNCPVCEAARWEHPRLSHKKDPAFQRTYPRADGTFLRLRPGRPVRREAAPLSTMWGFPGGSHPGRFFFSLFFFERSKKKRCPARGGMNPAFRSQPRLVERKVFTSPASNAIIKSIWKPAGNSRAFS